MLDVQTVKGFIEKVKAGGNKHVELLMYPGEGHGFMNGGEDIHKMMKSGSLLCWLLALFSPCLTLSICPALNRDLLLFAVHGRFHCAACIVGPKHHNEMHAASPLECSAAARLNIEGSPIWAVMFVAACQQEAALYKMLL